ncbi:hypothetical protein [Bosea sp. (in: a-proteobacteria)]|uniref:hypothetical protein n=1 Tax=Bosea sp. (in: a-proteobacteria) TaxID=1871050 RepID=UPI002FCBAF33
MKPARVLSAACALALLPALPALAQAKRPPAQIKITNARTIPLESLEIATSGEQPRLVARLAKPLAPGQSVSLKLNKPAGCSYYVLGKFSDEAESDNDGVDLCRERTLRLTD